jgi:hypothetical protein
VEGAHSVKDLKKNLRKAEKAEVDIEVVGEFDWTDQERMASVADGIGELKLRVVLAGTDLSVDNVVSLVDRRHRRYWLAKQGQTVCTVFAISVMR